MSGPKPSYPIYQPQEGSIAWKVIEFLTTNPEESLTKHDVAAKFDKPASNIHTLLRPAVDAGVLKRETDADGELAYCLGSGTPHITANPARHPTLRPDTLMAGVKLGKLPRDIAIDLTAIALLDDVPFPGRAGAAKLDWTVLFNRMRVGQSVVLPKRHRAILMKAVTRWKVDGKGEFTLRKISDTQVGLWRLK